MSKKSRLLTMAVCRRKVCAALPAFVLIGGSIALTAHAEPIDGAAVSKGSLAIVVPDIALTAPPVLGTPGSDLPAPVSTDPLAVPEPLAPALVLPEGTAPGSSTPVTLDGAGIPVLALEGYRAAVSLINSADPGCNIDWALVAAIGRVESDHARFGGNQLDSGGVAQPGIIGIPLDGSNGTARITDSDGGLLDRDTVFDRAVGPMQFIPSTWRFAGADADGDGVKNPQDMTDAAAAAAIYLCSGPGDLTQPGDLHSAIMRYNASESYVRTVIAIAEAYRHGVVALPASDLPASKPQASTLSAADRSAPTMALTAKAIALAKATTSRPGRTPTTPPRPRPAGGTGVVTPSTPTTAGAKPASPPAVPAVPGAAEPAAPVPAAPEPAAPDPAAAPAEPSTPAAPEPATPEPATPVPDADPAEPSTPAVPAPCQATSTQPCPPVPCPVTPDPVTPDPTTPDPTTPGEPASEPPCVPPCPPAAEGTTPAPTTPCLTPTASTAPETPIAPA